MYSSLCIPKEPFLTEDLAIPADAMAEGRSETIALVFRDREPQTSQLPIILWQYGLISLDQLNQIFD